MQVQSLQDKYNLVLKEKENLLRHLHASGVDPAQLSMDFGEKSDGQQSGGTQDAAQHDSSLEGELEGSWIM